MDNANRSPQLARIAASLGIFIIHTPPYQPEGCGKIERFFRSVREQSGQTPDARGQQNPDRGLAPGPRPLVALARYRLSLPRAQLASDHAAAALAA
jgi:transposase InsO family protein